VGGELFYTDRRDEDSSCSSKCYELACKLSAYIHKSFAVRHNRAFHH